MSRGKLLPDYVLAGHRQVGAKDNPTICPRAATMVQIVGWKNWVKLHT